MLIINSVCAGNFVNYEKNKIIPLCRAGDSHRAGGNNNTIVDQQYEWGFGMRTLDA